MKVTVEVDCTPEEARRFLDDAQKRLLALAIEAGRAGWVQENFITEDTQILAAARNEVLTGVSVDLAKRATRFDGIGPSASTSGSLRSSHSAWSSVVARCWARPRIASSAVLRVRFSELSAAF